MTKTKTGDKAVAVKAANPVVRVKAPAPQAPVVQAKPVVKVAAPIVPKIAPKQIAPEVISNTAALKAEKLFVPNVAPKAAPLTPAPIAALSKTKPEGNITMNDTVKQVQDTAQKFAADATAKVESFVADATAQSKTAYQKSTKMAEDAVAFQKDNLDAVVASSKLATAGVEKAAQHVAELSRKGFEDASAALKAAAGAKTPAEFFTLQNDFFKSSYESMVAETSKSSEATLKFFGEVFQPISSRFAVAADKVKAASAL